MGDVLRHCTGLPAVTFAAGDTVLSEGMAGRGLFILIEGTVAVSKSGVEVARVSEPGAVFGEMSALLDLPVSATLTAVVPTTAYLSSDAIEFFSQAPAVAVHTARLVASRLHHATRHLAEVQARSKGRTGPLSVVDRILEAMIDPPPRGARLLDDPRDDPRF
ncbi:MAG: cyclic nucleotide-binding domain-containing protein [Pseudomonadota bacterium]